MNDKRAKKSRALATSAFARTFARNSIKHALGHLRQLKQLMPTEPAAVGRVVVCLLLGGIAGYLVVPKLGSHAAAGGPTPAVLLDGQPLPVDVPADKTLEAARAIARTYVGGKVTLSVAGATDAAGKGVSRPRDELGARVASDRLASLVAQVRDPRSPLRRAYAQRAEGGNTAPIRLPLPVTVDGERAMSALLALKDDLDRAPVDARIDLGGGRGKVVLPDEPGRRVDVYATLARLDAALVDGKAAVDAVVETVPAARTTAQIQDVSVDDVLGYFETKYARDQKHEARTFNLKLAASKLDGHVVMPGETFDFNEVVGPRSEANGYRIATVIAQGELVDGIGGGTCQIAGTLHGAALFAGLDIVERKPHTRPSFYIKMGMDAAVAYPTITLKLRNPFPFPVVLHETLSGGIARAEILGPKRSRDVTFVRKVNEVTPFQEKDVPEPKIPKGERVLSQRGIPGFKITRYRVLRDGAFAVRERMQDVYPSTTQIWKVGTGDPDPKFEARDDEHPEYVADEYLSISQGPHVINPRTNAPSSDRGGATVESRVAGRYGTHGWTVKEGFSKATQGSGKGRSRAGADDDNPGVD